MDTFASDRYTVITRFEGLVTKSIKRLITLTGPANVWLLSEARRLGISVSEFVRRIIDEKRGSTGK